MSVTVHPCCIIDRETYTTHSGLVDVWTKTDYVIIACVTFGFGAPRKSIHFSLLFSLFTLACITYRWSFFHYRSISLFFRLLERNASFLAMVTWNTIRVRFTQSSGCFTRDSFRLNRVSFAVSFCRESYARTPYHE